MDLMRPNISSQRELIAYCKDNWVDKRLSYLNQIRWSKYVVIDCNRKSRKAYMSFIDYDYDNIIELIEIRGL